MVKKAKAGQNQTEQDLLLREISHKLDVLIGTMAVQGKESATQIRILTKLGLTSKEIGALLNLHADYVRRARTRK